MVKKPKRNGLIQGGGGGDFIDPTEYLHQTENPAVACTKLPEFIRAKKNLGSPFCIYVADGFVPDGTRVVVHAGNFKNPCAELKNNVSFVRNGVARFEDLRFLGKSGRGTRFNVFIRFETVPVKEAVYLNAIKVTVDGPRPPRNHKNKIQSNISVKDFALSPSHMATGVSQMKPIKKRYREFLTELKTESPRFILKPAHALTPPISPPQPSQASSTPHEEVSLNSPWSTPRQIEFGSMASTISSALSPSIDDTYSKSDQPKLESPACGWIDRKSICQYLEIYMSLYKIRGCARFSNYLVDLIVSYLASSHSSSGGGMESHERFLVNYNLFYHQLVREEVLMRDLNKNAKF